MPFMKKEELEAEAKRLGVDISGMKYQEQVAAVSAALREKSSPNPVADPKPVKEKHEMGVSNEEMERRRNIEYGRKIYEDVKGKRIIIAPGIRPEAQNVLFKYDEVLGNEKQVQEVSLGLESLGNPSGDISNDATYRIIGESNKRVVAQSTIPKENAQIEFTPGEDWFPVIVEPITGRRGYPFNRYVKPYLIKAGVYEDYHDRFDNKRHPNNCFYICGWSCVDKDLVDWIMDDVNRKMREKNGK